MRFSGEFITTMYTNENASNSQLGMDDASVLVVNLLQQCIQTKRHLIHN
jgi:hypothetical protein